MAKLTRTQMVDLVEHRYFGNVVREDFAAVQTCFADDARITLYHGDNPIRQFFRRPQPDQQPLISFYGQLWQNFHVEFGYFRHVVDAESECCASTFVPLLTPKPQSTHPLEGKLTLNNCNFFWLRGGRISEMIIYYAKPAPNAEPESSAIAPRPKV